MEDQTKRYREVINKLINKSFPELKKGEVKLVEFPRFVSCWSFAGKGFENYYIFINKHRRNTSIKFLKSQLAHELSHIILDYFKKDFFSSLFHNFRKILSWWINTSFSRKIEIKTQKEVIKRGYAKESYLFAKEWEKIFSK